MTHLARAVSRFSSQTEFADRLSEVAASNGVERKVSQQVVSLWLKTPETFPAELCLSTEQLTAGEVSRFQLRPDVFGQPSSGEDVANQSTEEQTS